MSNFFPYIILGWQHIANPNGLDHVLFILVLCSVFSWGEWRKVAMLVTAFTLGHSVTLGMATMGILYPNVYVVELLIPLTILFTSLHNLFEVEKRKRWISQYLVALLFGLVHGLGFSNFFTTHMGDSPVVLPLLAFNCGLEAGQLMIVFLFFGLYGLLRWMWSFEHFLWTVFFAGAGGSVSVILILDRV